MRAEVGFKGSGQVWGAAEYSVFNWLLLLPLGTGPTWCQSATNTSLGCSGAQNEVEFGMWNTWMCSCRTGCSSMESQNSLSWEGSTRIAEFSSCTGSPRTTHVPQSIVPTPPELWSAAQGWSARLRCALHSQSSSLWRWHRDAAWYKTYRNTRGFFLKIPDIQASFKIPVLSKASFLKGCLWVCGCGHQPGVGSVSI